MKIISIDASTKSSGIACFENKKLLKYECLTASSENLFKRIEIMVKKINDFLEKEENIDYIIMEEVVPEATGSDQRVKMNKSIKTYKALMYLQGEVAKLINNKYPKTKLEFIYPSEWRSQCGIKQSKGIKRDTLKANDIAYVYNNFGIKVNDDIADSICIGLGWLYKKDEGTNEMMF